CTSPTSARSSSRCSRRTGPTRNCAPAAPVARSIPPPALERRRGGGAGMTTPFRVDLHTHILPPRLPDVRERFGYGGFVSLEPAEGGARMMVDGALFRDVPATTFDAARRIEECDRHGVAVQVLSTVPVMFCYWAEPEHALDVARGLNDHIAQTVRDHPRRFAGL